MTAPPPNDFHELPDVLDPDRRGVPGERAHRGVGMTTTTTQRLATILLGEDVLAFIATRREAHRAWRFIARDLYEATEGQVDVTYETLRQWFGEVAA